MSKKRVSKKVAKREVSLVQVEAVRRSEIEAVRRATPAVVRQASEIVVDSAERESEAYEVVCQIKQMVRAADSKRLAITRPLDAAKKETVKLFRELCQPLEAARLQLEERIADWREEQQRIADEAEAERLAEIAELEAKQQAELDKVESLRTAKARERAQERADELDDQVSELEQVEYVADRGAAVVAKVWTYEVEDEAAVPREYCSPDRGKLRAAVRDGVREIAGVRVFQQSSVRSR